MVRILDENQGMFNMGEGCPVHGEAHMRECTVCGAEFCRSCHPRSLACPDCATAGELDEEPGEADFAEVDKVDKVLDKEDDEAAADTDDEEESP